MIAQLNGQIGLAYAFVEREIALSKRYWAWEIVWLVYGIVTSLSVAYIGLAAAAFPLMWTEKGLQMAYIVQAVVLLVSGVYYPVSVLPAWMQVLSTISPATYVIRGMRSALMDGADLASLWPEVWPALVVGLLSIPLGLRLFVAVERYAKRTGRLKRSGEVSRHSVSVDSGRRELNFEIAGLDDAM